MTVRHTPAPAGRKNGTAAAGPAQEQGQPQDQTQNQTQNQTPDRPQADAGPVPPFPTRRRVLAAAGGLAAGFSAIGGLAATPPARAGAENGTAASDTGAPATVRSAASGRVSRQRLDELVAAAFPLFNAPVVLPAFDAATQGAQNDVELHRLVSETVLPHTGERVAVTGLLALPAGASGRLPVLSWQHGTILSFDQVPSGLVRLAQPDFEPADATDSLETLFNLHRFAARGYAVIAADYVGKGPLRAGRGEAYTVRDVTVRTCLDMLSAGEGAMRARGLEPGALFLHGWSQGALNTQWLHQALRSSGRAVTGTATASPFNDLVETWRYWAGAQTFPLPAGVKSYPALPDWIALCMIMVLGSYELNYGLPGLMKSALRPDHRALADTFWQTYALSADDLKSVPAGPALLVAGFFDRFTDNRNSAFLRRLAANTATCWNYDAPVRFCYGLADEAIHPDMACRPLAAGGAMTQGVAVAGASHRATFLAGLYGSPATLSGHDNVPAWFATLA
ncbi:lysophospholipase [Pseudoxanthobacter sp.]|uniref:S9 family peptidase n=1 Tax=Pseudoxanthobacter sp. TaxID=1925742 RepID=UPI002FE118A4